MSFIGTAVNIWVDTFGTGGSPSSAGSFLLLNNGSYLLQNDNISKIILNSDEIITSNLLLANGVDYLLLNDGVSALQLE